MCGYWFFGEGGLESGVRKMDGIWVVERSREDIRLSSYRVVLVEWGILVFVMCLLFSRFLVNFC